jgi:SAM-dependent methyltransferase
MDKGEIRAAYDRVAADYDRHYGKPVHKAENTAVSVDLHFLIGKDDTVLDIGSGTGLLLELARLRPKKYLGIDLSPEMCRVA